MAPVLQCPDCGTKHPVDRAGNGSAFPCDGCGRMLKVPPQLRLAPPTPSSPRSSLPPSSPAATTRVLPRVEPSATHVRARATRVSRWLRLGLWIVAVPVSFAVVFGAARALGWLSNADVTDVFLDTTWSRFWPVARLLPFVALLTATIVHGGAIGLSRLGRRAPRQP